MQYPSLFAEIGVSEDEARKKINDVFEKIFFDPIVKFYYESDDNMGYIMDTGNSDARTEGMSYGMMMAVQMDRKDIFDRLWLFSETHMHHDKGRFAGYFAWSVSPQGFHNAEGPAPDGEEYYACALFFASARWGDGEAPFNYGEQARNILRHCVHQHEMVENGRPMWEPQNRLIKFVPEAPFTDPSYHLPHFYEIFAERADECDRDFWKKAAAASREFLALACHPETGMAPEYAYYDGGPCNRFSKQQQFYSDSYRVAMNIGLDAAWFGKTPELTECVNNLQTWFSENTRLGDYDSYLIDGTPIGLPALHPNAIIATTGVASLASDGKYRKEWIGNLWDLPLRKGNRRYYDNCLHFFCLLMASGEYKIY